MRRSSVSVLACAALAAGCGGPHTPVPVGGVVTLDGRPVGGATVSFFRDGDGEEGRPAVGSTDADGRYRLSTLGSADGALPGEYRVVVAKWGPGLPGLKVPDYPDTPDGQHRRDAFVERAYRGKPRHRTLLPAAYAGPDTTPLRFTVHSKTSAADFALKSDTPVR